MGESLRLGNVRTGIVPDQRAQVAAINRLGKLPPKCQECHPQLRKRCHLCFASNQKAYGTLYEVSDNATVGAGRTHGGRCDARDSHTAFGRWLVAVRAAGQHPGGNDTCQRLDCKKYKSASAPASRPTSRPPIWWRRCGG